MPDLKYLLEKHLEALVGVRGLLDGERHDLLQRAEGDIARRVIGKKGALARLLESAQELKRFLKREGATANAAGLLHCIDHARNAGELRDLRAEILEELRICVDHNRTNGAVLECKLAASERALRVLVSPQNNSERYRPTGKLENGGAQKSIGLA